MKSKPATGGQPTGHDDQSAIVDRHAALAAGGADDRSTSAEAPRPVASGRLVGRLLSGAVVGGRSLEALLAGAEYARFDYHRRSIVAHGGPIVAANATPNRPRFPLPAGHDAEPIPLTLQVLGRRVLRLRFGKPAAVAGEILLNPEPAALPLTGEEIEGVWTIGGGELRITIEGDPFRLRVERSDGPPFALAYHDRDVFGHLVTPPLALLDGEAGGRATIAWALAPEERLYGLGERFAAFDQRGRRVVCWATDAWGTTTEAAYKGCPLVCSSAGYALFAHTTARVEADLGATSAAAAALTVDDGGLDLFLFLGPDLKGVLGEYTALTGRMPMPPRWVFGLWTSRCRYQTRAEVEAVVERFRAEEIPLDVVNLDPAWLRTPALNCDFVWDEDAFPDPAGMVRGLLAEGVKTCLWEVPYLAEGTPLHAEARRRGYLLMGSDGEPISTLDGAFLPELRRGLVDFTNPEAAAWWRRQHEPLLAMGVAAFKTDFGEAVPADARSAGGLDGRRLRNLYPLLYNRTVWEATAAANEGVGFVWGRSGWAGSQRYPAQWGGDPPTNGVGFAGCLRGGLNWALCAPGAWSHDIGGFAGPPPSRGLYVRWAQCGLLSPLARFHGTTPREPWAFGGEALRIVREYARLRSRLLPYLLAVAWEAHRDGLPMFRPLVLEFPRDRGAWDVDDAYLLGSSLLVAPVIDERLEPVPRAIYLPAGEWVDFWSGELLEGGRFVERLVPLDVLPLFLRRGALLPLGPTMRHVDALPIDPLTIHCAPLGASALTIPEADGSLTRLAVETVADGVRLAVEGSVARRYAFELGALPRPRSATFAAEAVPMAYERESRMVHVETVPTRAGELRLGW